MSRSDYNRHHLYFPRRDYKSSVEREFRNLPCNIVLLEIEAHRLLHLRHQPPVKPKQAIMLAAIHLHRQGHCPQCHGV